MLSEAIELRTSAGGDDIERLVHLLVRELHDLKELEGAMLGAGRRDTREEVDVSQVPQPYVGGRYAYRGISRALMTGYVLE